MVEHGLVERQRRDRRDEREEEEHAKDTRSLLIQTHAARTPSLGSLGGGAIRRPFRSQWPPYALQAVGNNRASPDRKPVTIVSLLEGRRPRTCIGFPGSHARSGSRPADRPPGRTSAARWYRTRPPPPDATGSRARRGSGASHPRGHKATRIRVGAQLCCARPDHLLEDLNPARVLVSEMTTLPLRVARREADARIAGGRSPDELVERDLMGLGERQEQLEARLALAALQPRQRALRDPRPWPPAPSG